MFVVKKLLLILGATFLSALLFATAINLSVLSVAGEPEPIKNILKDSGIYSTIVTNQLEQAKKNVSSSGELSLTDPAIRDAAERAITPQYLEENVGKVIDSVYDWLKGKTQTPEFQVDLSGVKGTFADLAAQAAQTRATQLPACTAAGQSASFDAFSATCLPKGTAPSKVAADVKNNILTGEGFLDKSVLNANDIKSSGSDTSIFESDLKELPNAYRKFKTAPIILSILSLVAIAAIVFGSSSKRRGLRRAGITLLVIGLILVGLGRAVNSALPTKILPKINVNNNAALSSNVRSVVNGVVTKLDNTYVLVGAIYAGLGALFIAGTIFIGKGESRPIHEKAAAAEASNHEEEPPEDEEPPKKPSPPPPPPKKEPPKTRKITVT